MEPNNAKPFAYLKNKGEVEKIFNLFDTNGDGKISAAELANVLRALGSDATPKEVSCMMTDLDTDRFINLSKFAEFCDESSPAVSGESIVVWLLRKYWRC